MLENTESGAGNAVQLQSTGLVYNALSLRRITIKKLKNKQNQKKKCKIKKMFTIVAEDSNNCLSVTDSTSTQKDADDMNRTICHLNRTCVPYP